jgi:hypothetical protein
MCSCAARSLAEGLEQTLTVHQLGITCDSRDMTLQILMSDGVETVKSAIDAHSGNATFAGKMESQRLSTSTFRLGRFLLWDNSGLNARLTVWLLAVLILVAPGISSPDTTARDSRRHVCTTGVRLFRCAAKYERLSTQTVCGNENSVGAKRQTAIRRLPILTRVLSQRPPPPASSSI